MKSMFLITIILVIGIEEVALGGARGCTIRTIFVVFILMVTYRFHRSDGSS